jgi:hypothetical protein
LPISFQRESVSQKLDEGSNALGQAPVRQKHGIQGAFWQGIAIQQSHVGAQITGHLDALVPISSFGTPIPAFGLVVDQTIEIQQVARRERHTVLADVVR